MTAHNALNLSTETEDEIVRAYQSGRFRVPALAAQYRMSETSLYKMLDRRGVPRASRKAFETNKVKEIADKYRNGASADDLAAEYGVQRSTVLRTLRREGFEVRPTGRRPWRRFTDEDIERMESMWRAGDSQTKIAKAFDTAQVVVSRIFAQRGIRLEKRSGSKPGALSGNWKGGRSITEGGYVLVWIEPDDPMASMRNRSGYVLEHRLVMARALGRPLTKNETVHHIDGNRQHNDLSNLQLRNGRHGKGTVLRCLDCGSHNVAPAPLAEQPVADDAY